MFLTLIRQELLIHLMSARFLLPAGRYYTPTRCREYVRPDRVHMKSDSPTIARKKR